MRNLLVAATAGSLVLLGACSRYWNAYKAPDGFGIVREHVVSVPNNFAPIRSNFDYTITRIDGGPITRETYPKFVDLQPGALVAAGVHRFEARVAPVVVPRGYKPEEVSFEARVESGKVYFLVDHENRPALVEARPRFP
jgi:hypothetical protein